MAKETETIKTSDEIMVVKDGKLAFLPIETTVEFTPPESVEEALARLQGDPKVVLAALTKTLRNSAEADAIAVEIAKTEGLRAINKESVMTQVNAFKMLPRFAVDWPKGGGSAKTATGVEFKNRKEQTEAVMAWLSPAVIEELLTVPV